MSAGNRNPFTPRFGQVPAHLAGRERIIEDMTAAFSRGEDDPNLCSVFVGARGTGKTAMLGCIASIAEQNGWVVANVTALPGMLEDIVLQVENAGSELLEKPSSRKVSGVSVAGIGGITLKDNADQPVNWRMRMSNLLDQLGRSDTGVLITVDELDCSIEEMDQLATVYQHFVREGRKCALLMAGLPHRVLALLSGKSTSFLRRASRFDLGPIPRYEVEEAFRLTVEDGGKTIDDDALEAAVEAINGFAYMFQLVGYRSWNFAGDQVSLSVENVRKGIKLAREELADRVFDATYDELSKGDIAFLTAMSKDNGETTREDLKKRLNKSSSHISTYKKRLLEAGVIEEPRSGTFRFALPGFDDYVRERAR